MAAVEQRITVSGQATGGGLTPARHRAQPSRGGRRSHSAESPGRCGRLHGDAARRHLRQLQPHRVGDRHGVERERDVVHVGRHSDQQRAERQRLRLPRSGRDPGNQRRDARRLGGVSAGARRRHERGHEGRDEPWRGDGLVLLGAAGAHQRADHAALQLSAWARPDSSCTSTSTSARMPAARSSGSRLVLRRRQQRRAECAVPRRARHAGGASLDPRRIPFEPQADVEDQFEDELQPGLLLRVVALDDSGFSDAAESARDADLVHR